MSCHSHFVDPNFFDLCSLLSIYFVCFSRTSPLSPFITFQRSLVQALLFLLAREGTLLPSEASQQKSPFFVSRNPLPGPFPIVRKVPPRPWGLTADNCSISSPAAPWEIFWSTTLVTCLREGLRPFPSPFRGSEKAIPAIFGIVEYWPT